MNTGIFMDGSIGGLSYKTDNCTGILSADGEFSYEDGESIIFSIGSLALGSCMAKPLISTVDFIPEAVNKIGAVTHRVATNIARLLLSAGEITPEFVGVIEKIYYKLDFALSESDFENSEAMQKLIEETGIELISIQRTHNITRRCIKGIRKDFDVKIPTNQGHYVLADVYRPLIPGKYPVVMSMGAFGKSFINGFTITKEDEQYFDDIEDSYYESYGTAETKAKLQGAFGRRFASNSVPNPAIPNLEDGPAPEVFGGKSAFVPVSSVFEQAVADDWVPYGYVVINVEEYGYGANPGYARQFGIVNARDYYDAIEWAAVQPWSTGKIGLFGASYYAMTQYQVAQFHPKGLAAMIPIMGDYDSYRHYIYNGGGLLNIADNADLITSPQENRLMTAAIANPFLSEAAYGKNAEFMASADINEIDYPIWIAVEPDASLHGLGSSEAYINCPSCNKKMMFVNGAGIHYWMYNEEHMSRFRAFFDHWLKGIENGIMNESPVELQIRTGNGSYFSREENSWPVEETEYRKYYISDDKVGLSQIAPETEGSITYSADLKRTLVEINHGATLVSAPFDEDTEVAGYIKAGLYVSSTTADMEVHMNVRVVDENGREVKYPSYTSFERNLPLGFGSLKVSHRALDEKLSREDHPVYVHTEESNLPLVPGETVYCEIASFPTSGLIRKGWKLVLEISPISNRWVDYNEEGYRNGSENSLYFGGDYLSYVQIPVLPNKK